MSHRVLDDQGAGRGGEGGGRPGLTVRRARREDVPVIADFAEDMARETEGKRLDRRRLEAGVAGLFDRPQYGFYMVAEYERRVVGSLMITYEWSDWRNGLFWWLQSVYVLPAYRRRGVFGRLFEAVCEQARAGGGVCGLRLYVEKNNRVAQQTYRAMGMSDSPYLMFEQIFEP